MQVPMAPSLSFPLCNTYLVSSVCACSVKSNSYDPWTVARQALLSMEFSRQEYWGGLPFPSPGDLLEPGIKSSSLASPASAGRFVTTVPPGLKSPVQILSLIGFMP